MKYYYGVDTLGDWCDRTKPKSALWFTTQVIHQILFTQWRILHEAAGGPEGIWINDARWAWRSGSNPEQQFGWLHLATDYPIVKRGLPGFISFTTPIKA